jgi:hypothetical protein
MDRKYWDREIARLFRQDDADVKATAAYLQGKFNRKPSQGRPVNIHHKFWLLMRSGEAREIKREHGCTIEEALAIALKNAGVEDPDDRIAKLVWRYMRR